MSPVISRLDNTDAAVWVFFLFLLSSFFVSHLKTAWEGGTREDAGRSRARGNERGVSLMAFTENIMGTGERTEGPADYSSAGICVCSKANAWWDMTVCLVCISGVKQEWMQPAAVETGHVLSSWPRFVSNCNSGVSLWTSLMWNTSY